MLANVLHDQDKQILKCTKKTFLFSFNNKGIY